MFLGLLDPGPLVRGLNPDPAPDPSITKKKNSKKTLIPAVLWLLFDFFLKNDVNVLSRKTYDLSSAFQRFKNTAAAELFF